MTVEMKLLIDDQFLQLIYFFFSSRRRHTRLQGDRSSDVCSSDLERPGVPSCNQAPKRGPAGGGDDGLRLGRDGGGRDEGGGQRLCVETILARRDAHGDP